MSEFLVNKVTADGLAPIGARASAGAKSTKSKCHIYIYIYETGNCGVVWLDQDSSVVRTSQMVTLLDIFWWQYPNLNEISTEYYLTKSYYELTCILYIVIDITTNLLGTITQLFSHYALSNRLFSHQLCIESWAVSCPPVLWLFTTGQWYVQSCENLSWGPSQ